MVEGGEMEKDYCKTTDIRLSGTNGLTGYKALNGQMTFNAFLFSGTSPLNLR